MSAVISPELDPKVAVILEAAFEAFLKFGFRRASMADIAAGAGMSRAALYLHFKNKDDIFRSMIAVYHTERLQGLAAALAVETDVPTQIEAGFAAITQARFPALLDSPHGAEFLDAKSVAFADQAAQGDAQVVMSFGVWLDQAAVEGRLNYLPYGNSGLEVAQMMLKAMFGLKHCAMGYEAFARDRDSLARMFGVALAV